MAIAVKIDENIELMEVIAYLIGEISDKSVYNKDIDKYFALYKKHKAVKKIKQLLQKGLDVTALISFAVSLEYKKGSFVLRKKQSYLEKSDEFLALLADFYKVSSFHKFFKQHKVFYDKVCADFNDVAQSLNEEWFRNFYGFSEKDDFLVLLLPVLQSFYDGAHLVGYNKVDKKQIIQRLIYGYNYVFINSFLKDSLNKASELQALAEELFKFSAWAMKQQGIDNWQLMIKSYLACAASNVYMQENQFTKQEIREDIINSFSRGFYLMPELVGYFNKYRYCRDRFKTFPDFFSELVGFFARHTQREIKRVDEIANTILEV